MLGCSRSQLESPPCADDAGAATCTSSVPPQGLSTLATSPLPTLACDPSDQAFGSSPVMVVDSSNVYWMSATGACQNSGGLMGTPPESAAGAIQRTSLCGASSDVLLAPQAGASVIDPAFCVNAQGVFAILGDNGYAQPPIVNVSLGGRCSSTIVSGSAPTYLAADASYLYWTDQRAQTVMKQPLSGGAAVALTPPLGNTLVGIAVDDANAYVQLWQTGIERIPLEGGNATLLAATPDVGDLALLIVASSGNVFWSSSDSTTQTSSLSVVPAAGGTATVLTQDEVYGFATDGTNVYWTVSTCDAGQTGCNGALKEVPVNGGTAVTKTSAWTFQTQGAVAVDATSVYWTSGNTLMRFSPK